MPSPPDPNRTLDPAENSPDSQHAQPVPENAEVDGTHYGGAAEADGTRYGATAPPASGSQSSGSGHGAAPRVKRVGEYELIQELGRGGMGVVYKARDLKLHRTVAIKMIRGGGHASQADIDRFLAEARAEARLDHPHIVPVFEISESEGLPYFAMALVDGGSLQQRLAEGPLPAKLAARLVQQVAEGVQHAHDRGIIHRDLKPHNILLAKEEISNPTVTTGGSSGSGSGSGRTSSKRLLGTASVPKISDFGLARLAGEEGRTVTGEVLGTPSYMPPEQAAGRVKEIGPLSDVYSLGAVLYALLTGRPPFQAASSEMTIRQVLDQDPVPPRRLSAGVPRELEIICLKCLEKAPGRRYESAAALAEDLRRFLSNEPILARPTGALERAVKWAKRRPTTATLLAVVILLAAGGLGGITWAYSTAVRERDRAVIAEDDAKRERDRIQDLLAETREANRRRVRALIEQLGTAATVSVQGLLASLGEERQAVLPRLHEMWAEKEGDKQKRMRAGMALLPVEPEKVRDTLANWMLEVESTREVLLLRDVLEPQASALKGWLWQKAEDPKTPADARFHAMLALATYDPNNPEWRKVGPQAVSQLLAAKHPNILKTWTEAVLPVRQFLLPSLLAVFRGQSQPEHRGVAAKVLAVHAADEPDVLVDLIGEADAEQFDALRPTLRKAGDHLMKLLRQELAKQLKPEWADAPLPASSPAPDRALLHEIEQAGGLVAERFALCQTLPLARLRPVTESLRQTGYRPIRARPYLRGKEILVAVVWTRDGHDWQMSVGVDAGAVRTRDAALQKDGYLPEDVTGYSKAAAASADDSFIALWSKPAKPGLQARLYVGVPDTRLKAAGWGPLSDAGFVPKTHQFYRQEDGTRCATAVWTKVQTNPYYAFYHGLDEDGYLAKETVYHARVQIDVGLLDARFTGNLHEKGIEELTLAGKELLAKPDDLDGRFKRGQAYFFLRDDDRAFPDLDFYIKKSKEAFLAYWYRALLYARAGQKSLALVDVEAYRKRSKKPGMTAFLEAAVATYLGEDKTGVEKLEQAVKAAPTDTEVLFDVARGFATMSRIVAGQNIGGVAAAAGVATSPARLWNTVAIVGTLRREADQSQHYADRAIALLKDTLAKGYAHGANLWTDLNLEPLRTQPAFRDLLTQTSLDRQYSGIWQDSATLTSTDLHGLDPAAHLVRCRQLVAEGYRPVAIAVAETTPGKPLATASVWQRPVFPTAARLTLARRQANAAVALITLGQPEAAWPVLQLSAVPDARTYLIHAFSPFGIEARTLIQRLEAETDVSVRRALILALGEYKGQELPESERAALLPHLLDWYKNDPDPGIHGAIDWLLGHGREGPVQRALDWGQEAALLRIEEERRGKAPEKRHWLVNGQGQTFTVVPGRSSPVVGGPVAGHRNTDRASSLFWMGSPLEEQHRSTDEALHRVHVGRKYLLGTKPITVAQWQLFHKANPTIKHRYLERLSPEMNTPIINVTWYEAAQYCRWLSEQEGVPEDQMCYPSVAEIEECKNSTVPLKLPANYLERTGYRLPTEAEWEQACRAGTETPWYFGDSEEMLGRYSWNVKNSTDRTWPVGVQKPNDLGLFDMHGNVLQWCQESYSAYRSGHDGKPTPDVEDTRDVTKTLNRVVRGGVFLNLPRSLRSAYRLNQPPGFKNNSIGLRLARTCQ